MRWQAIVSMISIAISLGIGIFVIPNDTPDWQHAGIAITVEGTFRIMDDDIFFINDTSHRPINVASITMDNEMIYLTYAFDATLIHTFIIQADEHYTELGITPSASVARGCAIILLFDRDGNHVDPTLLDSAAGNFWFFGSFTIANDTMVIANDYT